VTGARPIGALVAVVLVSGAARAARADDGGRVRDGRFLRVATGLAYLHESWSPSGSAPGAIHTGWGPALEVALGKFVRPRLVLAGSVQVATAINRDETTLGMTYPLTDTLHFVDTISALVDFYPDALLGLHVGGSVGFATITEVDTYMGGAQTSWGLAAAVHAGHEWFVSRRWSVGGLARLAFHSYGTDTPPPAATANGVLFSVLAAATFD